MVRSLLLHGYSALSTTLSSTVTIWCDFYADYTSPCPSHRSRTAQRPQVPCLASSRHSVLLYRTFWWATLAMSVHRRGHCALCLQHTKLPQQTPLRKTPSRSSCSCVLPNTAPGVHFHSDFMKTFVKHRPQTAQTTRCQPHSPTQFSFDVFFGHCILSSALPPGPQPSTTLLLDAAVQTPSHSVASADATTQLPLTEFFLGCINSKDPLDRSVPPPTHGHVYSASPPQPSDIATINSLQSTSSTSCRHVCAPVPRARLNGTPLLPPGLEGQALLGISHNIPAVQALCSPHGILVKAAPVRP